MNTDGAFFLKEFSDRIEQSDYSKNYGIYTLYDKNAEIYLKRVYGGIYDILEKHLKVM